MDSVTRTQTGATVFSGPRAVALHGAIVLRRALLTYAETGIRMNRAYTPTAMLAAAGRLTGETYRRGQYLRAAEDLTRWIDATRAEIG